MPLCPTIPAIKVLDGKSPIPVVIQICQIHYLINRALRCDTCPKRRSARPSIPSSLVPNQIAPKRPVTYTKQHRCLFVNRPLFHPSYASSNLIFRTSCSISNVSWIAPPCYPLSTRTVYVLQIRTVYLLAT